MKLITLNTWGGRIYEPQVYFLRRHAASTDIFCFQEVYNGATRNKTKSGVITDMYTEYGKLLPDFTGFHAESGLYNLEETFVSYGIAIFYRKGLKVLETGIHEIFKQGEKLELPEGVVAWNRLLQFLTISLKNTSLTIFNLHGLYTGGGKNDVKPRIFQSERIKSFFEQHKGEKILCGDFNLNPDTSSLAILKENMRDLITENKITSTRSHYYPKNLKWADYILTTFGIQVKHFEVLPDVISDHLPLLLEFN
jgi:endonuclease/exonuclease/phosphatase family metal-dependent hydrolase